jgi:uncharacterized protein YodC (DUF2158 family)
MKPGDLVKLKSGGPVMTLGELSDTLRRTHVCYWFDHSHAPQKAVLPLEVLEPASNDS